MLNQSNNQLSPVEHILVLYKT